MSNDMQTLNNNSILSNTDLMTNLVRFSQLMASARIALPAHLRGNEGDCLAIAMQAHRWGMDAFAVASKTHVIQGNLGYEAQLVNAVINSMAPTRDRIHYDWFGPWENIVGKFQEKTSAKGNKFIAPAWDFKDEAGVGVKVWATMKGESEPRELSLLLSQAAVRNSTLWASDPKQQLAYLAVKRWSRLYCPDVILGVYTPDELDAPPEIDITERTISTKSSTLTEILDDEQEEQVQEQEQEQESEPVQDETKPEAETPTQEAESKQDDVKQEQFLEYIGNMINSTNEDALRQIFTEAWNWSKKGALDYRPRLKQVYDRKVSELNETA